MSELFSSIPQPYRSLMLRMVDTGLETAEKSAEAMYGMLTGHLDVLAKMADSHSRKETLSLIRRMLVQPTFMDVQTTADSVTDCLGRGAAFYFVYNTFTDGEGTAKSITIHPEQPDISYKWRRVSGGRATIIETAEDLTTRDDEELYGPYVALPGLDANKPVAVINGAGITILQGEPWFVLPQRGPKPIAIGSIPCPSVLQGWGPYYDLSFAEAKARGLRLNG